MEIPLNIQSFDKKKEHRFLPVTTLQLENSILTLLVNLKQRCIFLFGVGRHDVLEKLRLHCHV